MAETLRPFVYWGQKVDQISLKVDLTDVSNENVVLTEDGLKFTADAYGVKGYNRYEIDLEFYLPVDPDNSKYRVQGRAVEFQIQKSGDGEVWPRLTREKVKYPWLKIDFDKVAYEDESDKEQDEDPFVGFAYIVTVLCYRLIRNREEAIVSGFEAVGTQMMICQGIAILEILHPMLGLVKTSVIAPAMQVFGRNFVLFVVILHEPRLHEAPALYALFLVWSAIELIRYPFYMLSTIEKPLKLVTWLRYTIWIPLYPLGIFLEATIIIMSIPLYMQTKVFSLQLPNSYNMAFYFPWFLAAYLVVLAIAGYSMCSYMYRQRQKVLGNKKSKLNGKKRS
ncbi:hypothetical protein KUTeg_018230 [Tegillarca granosa]|uniref:Very-long-chain (3R)-3-hydroxyacyl-CoA dehydratase n=1 Tax=Tegillarca granosa TaxID=220873 RepID=A0ABQ9EM29_TEGGR|nr:hypothetical protein KUTeg_018230 [Tegillarca granosa]